MRPVVFRLVLCATLFGLWMGYLGYLVLTRPLTPQRTPLVLSRPQIQASDVDVIARIDQEPRGETEITVVEVLYPAKDGPKKGDKIKVARLEECRPGRRDNAPQPPNDWSGPGEYLVPLTAQEGEPGRFEVTQVPSSPGFHAPLFRIYPATPEALAQYRHIVIGADGQPHKPPRQ